MTRRNTRRRGTRRNGDYARYGDYAEFDRYGEDGDLRRKRPGVWFVVLVAAALAAAYLVVDRTTVWLQAHVSGPGAASDVQVGTWAVAIVLALFLWWCFKPRHRGGDRR